MRVLAQHHVLISFSSKLQTHSLVGYHVVVLTIESCRTCEFFRAGSKEETREAVQEAQVEVLLV